jgi:hypothetical protein
MKNIFPTVPGALPDEIVYTFSPPSSFDVGSLPRLFLSKVASDGSGRVLARFNYSRQFARDGLWHRFTPEQRELLRAADKKAQDLRDEADRLYALANTVSRQAREAMADSMGVRCPLSVRPRFV